MSRIPVSARGRANLFASSFVRGFGTIDVAGQATQDKRPFFYGNAGPASTYAIQGVDACFSSQYAFVAGFTSDGNGYFTFYCLRSPLTGLGALVTYTTVKSRGYGSSGYGLPRSCCSGPDGTVVLLYAPSTSFVATVPAILKSEDHGATWVEQIVSNMPYPYQIAYGNGTYVVAGTSYMMYSADALTWTKVALTGSFVRVAWLPRFNKFIAVNTTGGVIESTDGATWSSAVASGIAVTNAFPTLRGITDTGTRLILVGTAGARAYSEDGGATWTAGTALSTGDLSCTYSEDTGTIFVGNSSTDGKVYYSKDNGVSWEYTITRPYGARSMQARGGKVLAVKTLASVNCSREMWPGTFGPELKQDGNLIPFGSSSLNGLCNGAVYPEVNTTLGGGTGDFSIALSVRADTTVGTRYLLSSGTMSAITTSYWWLRMVDAGSGTYRFTFTVYTSGTQTLTFSANSTARTDWTVPHTVLLTRSGTALKFYIDGVLTNTGTSSATMPTCTGLIVGTAPAHSLGIVVQNVYIGNVQLCNRVLDASEVARGVL